MVTGSKPNSACDWVRLVVHHPLEKPRSGGTNGLCQCTMREEVHSRSAWWELDGAWQW
jgi:hypothetical protein